jgi:myosin heavy subunit
LKEKELILKHFYDDVHYDPIIFKNIKQESQIETNNEFISRLLKYKIEDCFHTNTLTNYLDQIFSFEFNLILCLLPNLQRNEDLFDHHTILSQIKNFNILENIKFTRRTFSNHHDPELFVKRYFMLIGKINLDLFLKNEGYTISKHCECILLSNGCLLKKDFQIEKIMCY